MAHFPGIPQKQREQIEQAMKRPEGTLEFGYTSPVLFDPAAGRGILLEIVTGQQVYRLERDEGLRMTFTHSTPGTGTRTAGVELKYLRGATKVKIAMAWSPNELRLNVFDATNPKRCVTGHGIPSSKQLRVGADGAVYELGDSGVQIGEVSMVVGGKTVLQSTAIQAWTNTVDAVRTALTGTSTEGYRYEVVISNMAIAMLVTGHESYCKRRFLELEDEGITPNFEEMIKKFLITAERNNGEAQNIVTLAATENVSPTKYVVDRKKIDFQAYDRCKTAYSKAYGIKFGEHLGVSNQLLEKLQQFIGFRHRIVHVSPSIGMLNQPNVPPEEPISSSRALADEAIRTFDSFIQGLHRATLQLRPNDSGTNP